MREPGAGRESHRLSRAGGEPSGSAHELSAALVIVDVQRDFCPAGALAVPRGDEVVPLLNAYIKLFRARNSMVVATRDWHPPDHCSFKHRGGPWPPHCVQETAGAAFHPDLELPADALIISKGTRRDAEAYSGFEGTHLARDLTLRAVRALYIGGLATDYCVKATVLDGLAAGFDVFFLEDASRGIDAKAGDCDQAVAAMRSRGAKSVGLQDLKGRER